MARTSFTVTELNAHIKQLLDADVLLGNVCVTGELSNYKVYPSGHIVNVHVSGVAFDK